MSKNFELLHHISNEKGLFQTLDGWEDAAEIAPESEQPNPEVDAKTQNNALHQTSLPDVFRAIGEPWEPLGPLDLDSNRNHEPVEEKGHWEILSSTLEDRFPISRNPITPLNAAPAVPAWAGHEIGPDSISETPVELEPEVRQSISNLGSLPGAERTNVFSEFSTQEPPSVKEESTDRAPHAEAAWRTEEVPQPQPPARPSVDAGKASEKNWGRKVRARGVYKDAKREAIAREEELKLVQRIFLGGEQNSPRIALFSGLERDAGCASICVRAGEILAAQAEGSVCLVDANFQSPSLHEYFDLQNNKGLAEATQESAPIQEFAQQLSPANLWLITGGYGASQLNIAKVTDRLRSRMEELRNAYRYVVFNSGPFWLNANAMLLSKWTDGVVLVLEANSTRRDTARRIKESLAVANTKVLGVVLNNRTYPIPEALYSRL